MDFGRGYFKIVAIAILVFVPDSVPGTVYGKLQVFSLNVKSPGTDQRMDQQDEFFSW
jgi:hypothetical protein